MRHRRLLAVFTVVAAVAGPVDAYAAAAPARASAAYLTPIKTPKPCPKGKFRCNGVCIPDRFLCRIG